MCVCVRERERERGVSETEGMCICVRKDGRVCVCERVLYNETKSSCRNLVQVKHLGEGFVGVCVSVCT